MKQKEIAIVHFNTPELTEAAIMSVRKHCTTDYHFTVLDNSDKRPFKTKMKGVKVIDNTKGQVIDFEAELSKYPDKEWNMAKLSNHGSMKHIWSVQKLWEMLPDGFILLESDVLITKNFDFLWNETFAACGKVQYFHNRRKEKDRLLPWLCYLNVPLLVKNGARYFDPMRAWNLQPGENNPGNWWDTGACVLDDIRKTKPELVCRCYAELDRYYIHYHGGSWRQADVENQKAWLENHRALWYTPENKDAKIFVCTHTDFEPVVRHKVYEVVDVRKFGDNEKGVPGPFYSELLHMYKVSKRKNLPKYIGFCQYRKYFSFLDNLPDIAAVIEQHGMITPTPVDLHMPMHDQWATWGNIEDIDIATAIVNEKYPELAKAWNMNLQKTSMHPGSLHVMKTEDWKQMVACAWDVTNEYLKRIGGDIDKRIEANPEKYHIGQYEFTDQPNERRVGGNICERIVSAWADWKYPNAAQYKLVITADKVAPNYDR
jgi:hypothetical protein